MRRTIRTTLVGLALLAAPISAHTGSDVENAAAAGVYESIVDNEDNFAAQQIDAYCDSLDKGLLYEVVDAIKDSIVQDIRTARNPITSLWLQEDTPSITLKSWIEFSGHPGEICKYLIHVTSNICGSHYSESLDFSEWRPVVNEGPYGEMYQFYDASLVANDAPQLDAFLPNTAVPVAGALRRAHTDPMMTYLAAAKHRYEETAEIKISLLAVPRTYDCYAPMVEDVDGDGDDDLRVYVTGIAAIDGATRTPISRTFYNDGHGHFSPKRSNPPPLPQHLRIRRDRP